MPDYRRPPAVDRSFGLTRDAFGRLVLIDSEGRRHIGVEPIRAFPITDPDHFIAIVDAEGVELLLIEDLSSLAPAVRQTLEEELARREFVPIIRQIARIT
ncbi:MAG: DUF1854 domain-containing protein, partial [Isosphaeraceae bacterium]|nr:DUF1854 domain-containing protein [Isosphaeraceae bacterium]